MPVAIFLESDCILWYNWITLPGLKNSYRIEFYWLISSAYKSKTSWLNCSIFRLKFSARENDLLTWWQDAKFCFEFLWMKKYYFELIVVCLLCNTRLRWHILTKFLLAFNKMHLTCNANKSKIKHILQRFKRLKMPGVQ